MTKVDFSERPFRVWVDRDEYRAHAVIVATGASARWLGLESEQRMQGRGVSACATCDGSFFKDKPIVVDRRRRHRVRGGALPDALRHEGARSCNRRDEFRASQIMVNRAAGEREDRASSRRTSSTRSSARQRVDRRAPAARRDRRDARRSRPSGFFVAIGHEPNTKLFVDQLDHDENGYLITKPGSTETNVPGVFAVGDVQDHIYRQAVTAAGSGCMGALDAERYLAEFEGHAGTALTAPRPEAEPAHAQRVASSRPQG